MGNLCITDKVRIMARRGSRTRSGGKEIQKVVRHTFTAITPADTGQELATITGAATITTNAWDVTTAPALTAVKKGMGEPDVYVTAAYTAASTSNESKNGVAFWGTSAAGGTWWAAYPTNTSSTVDTTNNFCTGTSTTTCNGSLNSNCSTAQFNSAPAACAPSSCAGCTPTCTTTSASCPGVGSFCNSSAVASCSSGSICGTCSSPGVSMFFECCECFFPTTSCVGSTINGNCFSSGCVPNAGAGCGACPTTNSGSVTTTFYAGVRIDSGTPGSMTQQSVNATLVGSTGGYPAVGGISVLTSANSVAVKLYSNTTLATQQGPTHTYNPASPTKGDFVGPYGPNAAVSVNTDTFTVEA
jgi:hypothetical protein